MCVCGDGSCSLTRGTLPDERTGGGAQGERSPDGGGLMNRGPLRTGQEQEGMTGVHTGAVPGAGLSSAEGKERQREGRIGSWL